MLFSIILTTEHVIAIAMILGGIIGFTLRTGRRVGRVEEKVHSTSGRVESLAQEVSKKAEKDELTQLKAELNQKHSALIKRTDAIYGILIKLAEGK